MNEEHVRELQGHTSIHPPERARAALWHSAEAFLLVLAMNNSGSTHGPLKYARFKIKHLLPSDCSWLGRSWLRGLRGSAEAQPPARVCGNAGAQRGHVGGNLLVAGTCRAQAGVVEHPGEQSVLLGAVPHLLLVKTQPCCWQTWLRA